MIRFYAPDAADTGRLPESDSGHAVRVLRLRAGDELQAKEETYIAVNGYA